MKLAIDPHINLPQSIFTNDKPDTSQKKEIALQEICQKFESIFVQKMFQEMRKTVPKTGYIQKDFSMNIYQEMFDKQVAQEMANRHHLGLSKALFEEYRSVENLGKKS